MSSSYKITVTSTEQVTPLTYENVFNLEEKLEATIILNNSSKVIDFSHVDSPRLLSIKTDNPVEVQIVHNANTINFVVDAIFSAVFDDTFFSNITSLTIAEVNSTDASVIVGIYGYTPA